MKLRVITAGATFMVVKNPEPRLGEDGRQEAERSTGVQLCAVDGSLGQVLTVVVPGAPEASVGWSVQVCGRVAHRWSQGDRGGVAFRAASIVPRPSGASVSAKSSAA